MPKRALPVAGMGTREGETPARYRRRSDLQGLGILYHRLPKRFLQGGGQKGISCRLWRWREIRHTEGTCQSFVACSDQAACEKAGQRRWLIGVIAAERDRCETHYSSKHSSRHGEQAVPPNHRHLFGSRVSSIIFCAMMKVTRRNGSTSDRILYAPGWSNLQKIGLIKVRSFGSTALSRVVTRVLTRRSRVRICG